METNRTNGGRFHNGFCSNPGSKLDLPILISQTEINSRPDSGSEENIMSASLVTQLGLVMKTSPEHRREFRMANGKMVKALGRTAAHCTFPTDPALKLYCLFYVFESLISPTIMGMAFLERTGTLTEYRYRLKPRTTSPTVPIQLCSIDYPRRRLYCLADEQPEFANADTGSEVDLISSTFAKERNFTVADVDLPDSMVQFADGSTSQLLGKVVISISLGKSESPPHIREFYILDGLSCDILLGEDFLDQVSAFTTYKYAISIDDEDDGIGEVYTITWLNTPEFRVSKVFERIRSAKPQSEQQRQGNPHSLLSHFEHQGVPD